MPHGFTQRFFYSKLFLQKNGFFATIKPMIKRFFIYENY